jgi:hypothetical protein
MRLLALLVLAFPAFAQDAEIQRAVIERDQRTEEFAARLRGAPLEEIQRLENLSARQLQQIQPDLPNELRPYERQKAAREIERFVLRLPPPVVRAQEPEKPLPLPAGIAPAVEVIPPQTRD